jgi:iron complex outermembrane receptor protein
MQLRRWALIAALAIPDSQAAAQRDTVTKIAPVVVTVTRSSERSILRSPFAITVVEPDSARPGQRHASADEMLAVIPGLVATSRNNPSQDPRLSIRGFGARSAFGVRGIRVLRDGIPLTLPDGQTPLDYMSLESVGRVEVLRGAASALYGNASGGVIDFRTLAPAATPFAAKATQWLGTAATSRTAVSLEGTTGELEYVGDVAYNRSDGLRRHSGQKSATGFARIAKAAGNSDYSLSLMALDNPRSENPGALTIDEMRADWRQSDMLSFRRDASKSVSQFQLGVSAAHRSGTAAFALSAYGGARSLDNPLTFAVVEIGRHTYGATATYRGDAPLFRMRHRISAGIDVQAQNDLRRNYATCADTVPITLPTVTCPIAGDDRGVVTLDQRELVSSAGLYVADEVSLGGKIDLTGGLRFDRVRFEVRDRLIRGTNPDDSGRRNLGALSPVAGIVGRVAPAHSLYANVSAAFETPTATELGNHADGTAGINPDLDPQRSTTFEAGAKGWVGTAIRYDAALFSTRVRDELVPFEIPQSNGRRYFRNAGRTSRRGAEFGLDLASGPMSLMVAYSFSRFRFDDYQSGADDFGGNEIPAIPHHRLQSAMRITHAGFFAVVETEAAGRSFVDDANTVSAAGYAVTGIRGGFNRASSLARFSLTAGTQNIFDKLYASSIAVNAARGKFYEPAQGRTIFVGMTVGAGVH